MTRDHVQTRWSGMVMEGSLAGQRLTHNFPIYERPMWANPPLFRDYSPPESIVDVDVSVDVETLIFDDGSSRKRLPGWYLSND